jgi:hypothetical protein
MLMAPMRTAAIAILCLSLCGSARAEPLHNLRLTLSASSPIADLSPSIAAATEPAAAKPMQQLSDLRLSIRCSAAQPGSCSSALPC